MLPSELKLTSLGHCYVHLPETFVSRKSAFKGGAIVSIKSIQNDHELFVMWNGQLTAGEHVELDLDFAQANNLQAELVIINSVDNLELSDCTFCHAELINSSDYAILSEHTEVSLLDTCKLINQGLIVPILISQHVKVLVKILSFEPSQPFGLLTKWTEMSFQHNPHDLNTDRGNTQAAPEVDGAGPENQIQNPLKYISFSLGLQYKPRYYLGSILVCGERGSGKTRFIENTLSKYKRHCFSSITNCKQFRGKRPESVKKMLNEILAQAIEKQPSIIVLDDLDSIAECDLKFEDEQNQQVMYQKRLADTLCQFLNQLVCQEKARVVLMASCRSMEQLDSLLANLEGRLFFNEVIKIELPNLEARVEILKSLVHERPRICCSLDEAQYLEIAKRCSNYMPSDFKSIFERALLSACSRSSLSFDSNPVTLSLNDFLDSLEGYVPRSLHSIKLESKRGRTFEDVGGMEKIKEILIKTILLPIKYPKLHKKFPSKSQKSILLYGPPGCGKTLVAEALTNQEGINSICVRGPELLSKYIGASEEAVRDVFARAQAARPCVVFFDEFESLVARRGTDSTGVTDRVVNQFLTILDGAVQLSDEVFILAASSRPDMIDPAMLRPGRMEKHIYCPLPDASDRLDIIKVLSKNIDLDPTVDLSSWSVKLDGFTGADLKAFLFSAQLKSLHEMIGSSSGDSGGGVQKFNLDSNKNKETIKDFDIVINERHLISSHDEMKVDVAEKSQHFAEQYPAEINRVRGQGVAKRITLA